MQTYAWKDKRTENYTDEDLEKSESDSDSNDETESDIWYWWWWIWQIICWKYFNNRILIKYVNHALLGFYLCQSF